MRTTTKLLRFTVMVMSFIILNSSSTTLSRESSTLFRSSYLFRRASIADDGDHGSLASDIQCLTATGGHRILVSRFKFENQQSLCDESSFDCVRLKRVHVRRLRTRGSKILSWQLLTTADVIGQSIPIPEQRPSSSKWVDRASKIMWAGRFTW